MQNNDSEALTPDNSKKLHSWHGKETDRNAQTELNMALRQRAESELRALSRFICGHEYGASANGLFLDDGTLSRATAIDSSFQISFLRGELLWTAIQVFRLSINDLLRPYEELARLNTQAPTTWDRPSAPPTLKSNGDHLNLLHRLVLVMIFREGYVIRACGLMLGCRDSVVEVLRDEGLTRLNCA